MYLAKKKKESNTTYLPLFKLDQYIKAICRHDSTFEVQKSGYTAKIKFNGKTLVFTDNKIKFNVFHIANRLKKELEPVIPSLEINKRELDYYFLNKEFEESETVFNIDIKSAYLSILKQFITEKTFNEINELEKKERLICLGLLAYRPIIFRYLNGEEFDFFVKENEYENAFFYCVKKTGEIMNECRQVLGKDFIFSWVDGVYFQPTEENKQKVVSVMEKHGLKFSFDILENFNVEYTDNGIFFNYQKESDKKRLFVPNTDQKTRYKKTQAIKKYLSATDKEKKISLLYDIIKTTKNNA